MAIGKWNINAQAKFGDKKVSFLSKCNMESAYVVHIFTDPQHSLDSTL